MPSLTDGSPRLRLIITAAALSVLTITVLVFSRDADNSGKYIPKAANRYTGKSKSQQTQFSTCLSCDTNTSWEFVLERDADNHGLSEEQCKVAFPKLFVELERSVRERANRSISYKEVDSVEVGDGMVRGVISNGEVCFLHSKSPG